MAALMYPAIDPVLFEIGPLAVRWYGLSYVAGFIVAAMIFSWLNRRWKVGLSTDDMLTVVLYCVIGVLVGSRIGWVLFYGGSAYLLDPVRILATWEGGMSWHGGFLGILAAGWVLSRRLNLSFVTLADMGAVGAPAGFLFGRIANFINGELWGRVTDVPWGMVFPGAGPLPRHPSQLYEAGLEGLVMLVVLALLARNRRPAGFYFGAFMLLYGTFRALVELVREPDASLGFVLGPLTMGQVLSLPVALVGAWFVWRAVSSRMTGGKEES
ncbi:MAG: prolipoprotein diacylglyceryl transferase [Coriobacteriia bacterium]|nr:prolipoprotein diacylglyceryl transferase [Coriobacteriia bacterium]